MHVSIKHSPNGENTTDDCTDTGEEADPPFPVLFQLHVQRRHLVEEKDLKGRVGA